MADQTPEQTQQPATPAPAPQATDDSVAMISPDYKSVKMVPAQQVDDAKGQKWETATKMIDKDGNKKWVPSSQLHLARENKFAVDPTSPGARPALIPDSREGTKMYVAPEEADEMAKNGMHILPTDAEEKILAEDLKKGRAQQNPVAKMLAMQPDAQSPEAKAIRDKIQNWQVMQLANSDLMKEQVKDKAVGGAVVVGVPATIAASTAAPEVAGAGLRYLGRGALPGMEDEIGRQVLKQGAKVAGKWALKKIVVPGLGTAGSVGLGYKILKSIGLF